MNDIRICAVVTGKTIGEFLKNLEEVQKIADLVELRVDCIDGFSVGDIDLIKSKTKKQAIFTCRKKEEGGFFTGAESERMVILEKAIEVGFDYVDVELSSNSNVSFKDCFAALAMTTKKRAKIILSFHDFAKTSSLAELEEIKKQMKKYNPDIMKFATLVRDDRDSKILFQFLLNKQDDEKMIVVGMGEEGKLTRVVAPLLGSYLTYASNDYSISAPGQVDIIRLKKLYNELGEL
jgi:3-dehydroquinate dehydratase-1